MVGLADGIFRSALLDHEVCRHRLQKESAQPA